MLSIGDILPPFATLTSPLFPTQCLPIHNLHPRHFFAAIMYINPPLYPRGSFEETPMTTSSAPCP